MIMLKVTFALLPFVVLALCCFSEVTEDDALSENNRDPPSLPVFIRQTYKAVSELAFNSAMYPYDHEFTMRMFSEGSPTSRQVAAILLLALTFILFRYFSQPLLRVSCQTSQ